MTSGRGSDFQNNAFSYLAPGNDGGIFPAAKLSQANLGDAVDTVSAPFMSNNSVTYLIDSPLEA